jgi:hypothetical protein
LKTSKKLEPPELPVGTPGRPQKERYKEQYGVIVVLLSEEDQRIAYDQLQALGHKCRVVTT